MTPRFGLTRVDRAIIEIAQDNRTGASEIVQRVVACFQKYAEDFEGDPKDYFPGLVHNGKKIIDAQPSMAPVFNCVNDLLCTLEDVSKGVMPQMTLDWAKAYIDELNKARSILIKNGKKIIKKGDRIMVFSYSSAVLDLLMGCRSKGISVITSEARPIREGVDLARILGQKKIPVTLVVDSALPGYLSQVDRVLVGADAITEKGIVNKVGTWSLAMLARLKKIPFHVVAERNKFAMSGYFDPCFKEQPAIEVAHETMKNVTVRNIYFDSTSFDLVSGIISDHGIKTPDETMGFLKGRKICNDLLVDELDIVVPENPAQKGSRLKYLLDH